MTREDLSIEKVRVKDLYDFAHRFSDGGNGSQGTDPIGKRRALACRENPYADSEDIGLLVAWMDGRCIGYLGLLPGVLRTEGRDAKVHWLSTWFVQPEHRTTSAAVQLLLTAMSLEYDLVVTAMSPEAERVYRGLGFAFLGALHYYTVQFNALNPLHLALRTVRKIVRLARPGWDAPRAPFRVSNRLFAPGQRLLYDRLFGEAPGTLGPVAERVTELDGDDMSSSDGCERSCFYRGPEAVNWMLNYPWTTPVSDNGATRSNYHFAELREEFEFIALRLRPGLSGERSGFVVCSFSHDESDSVFKVLDFQAREAKEQRQVANLAIAYARERRANVIELPAELGEGLAKGPARLVCRRRRRRYLCRPARASSPLAKALAMDDWSLSYCDGDTAFT